MTATPSDTPSGASSDTTTDTTPDPAIGPEHDPPEQASGRRKSVAVLGAGGSAGTAIVHACIAAGHDVIAVTRTGVAPTDPAAVGGPGDLTRRGADLSDAAATAAAVEGAGVVVMAANLPYPRWEAELTDFVDGAADAAAAAGARFLFVDNLYMYAPATGPIDERSPEHATDTKGALRRRIGERLLARHRAGELRVTIARLSDFFGPGATSSVLYATGIRPGLAGKRMRALFDLDQPHAYAYLPDAGRAIAELVEDPDADGRVWVLPATTTATQREMLTAVNEHLAKPVGIGVIGASMLRVAGLVSPMLRELRSVRPQFARPWQVDSSEFDERFAFRTTDPGEAVGGTVDSFRST